MNPDSYQWTVLDASGNVLQEANGVSFVLEAPDDGVYTVKLTVTDKDVPSDRTR